MIFLQHFKDETSFHFTHAGKPISLYCVVTTPALKVSSGTSCIRCNVILARYLQNVRLSLLHMINVSRIAILLQNLIIAWHNNQLTVRLRYEFGKQRGFYQQRGLVHYVPRWNVVIMFGPKEIKGNLHRRDKK